MTLVAQIARFGRLAAFPLVEFLYIKKIQVIFYYRLPPTMPRRSNLALKNRFKHGNKIRSLSTAPVYQNWFVDIHHCAGTGYIERFMSQCKSCSYAEYYIVDNPEDHTHTIHGYLQTRRKSHNAMIVKFNCKTTLTPTTIAAKARSNFNSVEPKIKIGIETIDDEMSSTGSLVVATTMPLLHTTVKIAPKPVPTNSSCWLMQAPRPDPCLNRKKVYPINYDV